MSRDLTTDMQTEVQQPMVKPVLLAEFDFDDGTLYMWSGVGSLVWNGKTYTGGGNLCGVSNYAETSDLASQGLTFVLNGIPPALVSVALEENYQMRPCRLYFGFVNRSYGPSEYTELESGSGSEELESGTGNVLLESSGSSNYLVDDPYILFDGFMDTMVAVDDGQTATIKLNAENPTFILSQPNVHYYTDQDQQASYPGDLGLGFIAGLQDASVVWGVPGALP